MSTSPATSTIRMSAAREELSSKAGVLIGQRSCRRSYHGLPGAVALRTPLQPDGGSVPVGLDLDVAHHALHQHDPPAALVVGHRLEPAAAVGDLDPERPA